MLPNVDLSNCYSHLFSDEGCCCWWSDVLNDDLRRRRKIDYFLQSLVKPKPGCQDSTVSNLCVSVGSFGSLPPNSAFVVKCWLKEDNLQIEGGGQFDVKCRRNRERGKLSGGIFQLQKGCLLVPNQLHHESSTVSLLTQPIPGHGGSRALALPRYWDCCDLFYQTVLLLPLLLVN